MAGKPRRPVSWSFLLYRLLLAIPTLLGVAVVVFVLLRVVPGDPIAMLIGPDATEEDVANLRRLYGLDESTGVSRARRAEPISRWAGSPEVRTGGSAT